MSIIRFSADTYLDSVVGKALRINKQALALTMPYILADRLPNTTLLYVDDKTPVLCDKRYMWKVVCGKKYFDISPSYTKGYARDKYGADPISQLKDKGYDGVAFVDFTETNNVVVCFKMLNQLNDTPNGVYKKGEIFE